MKKLIMDMRKMKIFIAFVMILSTPDTFSQKVNSAGNVKKGNTGLSPEYVDVIELSPHKNSYVDVKGTQPLSVDVGGQKAAISLEVQPNSNIVKLKANRNFPDANMIIVCKDTVLQFLIKYRQVPSKTYYPYSFDELRRKHSIAAAEMKNSNPVQSRVNNSPVVVGTPGHKTSHEKWRDSSATVDTRYGIEGRNEPLTKADVNKANSSGIDKQQIYKPNEKKEVTNGASNSTGKYLREEVYEKLRAKPVNINIGDLDGGVRIVLDRIYKDGDIYYYSLTIHNRQKTDFPIDYAGFEIHRKGNNQSSHTDIIKLYQPSNNPTVVMADAKSSIVLSTDQVEMLPEEFLFITVSGGQKEIKIKLKQVDFGRASVIRL